MLDELIKLHENIEIDHRYSANNKKLFKYSTFIIKFDDTYNNARILQS